MYPKRWMVAAAALAVVMLVGIGAAQEPTPAFIWHSDEAVGLPPGAMALAEEPCFGLFAEMGLFDAEPKACYLVVEPDGVAEYLVAAFNAAGYALDEEAELVEGAVAYSFSRPDRGAREVAVLLESDGSMFILGYQESAG